MTTKKTKKKTKAEQQEIDKINLQIKQYQENIKQMKEQIRMDQQAVEKLKDEKRKLKENKEMHDHPVVWDDYTPMIVLVFSWKKARFKKMVLGWQKHSHREINPEKTFYFDFDLVYQKSVISDLKSAMNKSNPLFMMSNRQLIMYMSKHSNLGSFDAIKKAIQRQE